MDIPDGIKHAVVTGLICPLCKEGHLEIVPVRFYNAVKCDKCHKPFIIKYHNDPFEILDIVEDESRI